MHINAHSAYKQLFTGSQCVNTLLPNISKISWGWTN